MVQDFAGFHQTSLSLIESPVQKVLLSTLCQALAIAIAFEHYDVTLFDVEFAQTAQIAFEILADVVGHPQVRSLLLHSVVTEIINKSDVNNWGKK